MKKTVVALDLVGFSDKARELQEHLDAAAVMQFQDQIQQFVDHGLQAAGQKRQSAVFSNTGDGALLLFNEAVAAHNFAMAVHRSCVEHNRIRPTPATQRWFRIGAATGDVAIRMDQQGRTYAGLTISVAARLEAAGHSGHFLVDITTFGDLPPELQQDYLDEEEIPGKRDEQFRTRRCVMAVPPVDSDQPCRRLTLTIDGELESFNNDEQDALLIAICKVAGIRDGVTVVRKENGSVRLTIELTNDDVEHLMQAFHADRLSQLNIRKVELQPHGKGGLDITAPKVTAPAIIVKRFEDLAAVCDHGDRPEQIKGRDELADQIMADVWRNSERRIFIHAKAGLGKTALMKVIRGRAENSGVLTAFYRFNRPLNDRDLGNCLLSLTYQVQAVSTRGVPDEFRDFPVHDRIQQLRKQLSSTVREASAVLQSRGQQLLILVDALDEMKWDEAYGEMANPIGISSSPMENVARILSTRDRRFIPAGAPTHEIQRSDTSHQQAVDAYINYKLQDEGIKAAFATPESIDQLVEASQCNFMYLWSVFQDIVGGQFDYLTSGNLPLGLIGYYERHWETLWEDERDRTPEAMKVLLSLAFSGVTYNGQQFPEASFSAELLISVSGITIRSELFRILKKWKQFIEHRPVGSSTLYGFYHSSYLEFLLGQLEESRQNDLIAEAMDEMGLDPEAVFKEISTALNVWFFNELEMLKG